MNRSSAKHRYVRFPVLAALASIAWLAPNASAQEAVRLSAGDSIRVDRQIVGSILSIDGPTLIVVSRDAPRCRAGEMHGDAPICDPAPLRRHTMNLDEVYIEQRLEKSHLTLRTLAGGVVGAVAFGWAGSVIGPKVGFGKVSGCLIGESNINCPTGSPRYTAEDLESRQLTSDQRKGAFFFGMLGGTATAILVRKLSVGWVQIQPVLSAGPEEPWGLNFSLPVR